MTEDVYRKPQQTRAITTEQRFLEALHDVLGEKSFRLLTIDDIAERAGLTRSAFLKRFGSKKRALLVMYERYCDKVFEVMTQIEQDLPLYTSAQDACSQMSRHAERLQVADFPVNRAMHEIFQEDLAVDPRTKAIFRKGVDLMRKIQKQWLQDIPTTDAGAYAAAQLLFTIDYNYVLKAMPGLPADPQTRHRLIGNITAQALTL
ncbi:MAG: TetR/AcrR family transcriptional regulator [Limnohabitans sp.]